MFRNFYAEQNMADPRDSWFKPNLLYNIHYKPPKPSTQPKMMVVTREFNPSICTCGEHGCEPHYRMEREVVWSNKEAKSKEDRALREIVQVERNVTTKLEYDYSSQNDGESDDDSDKADENDEKWGSDASFDGNVDGIQDKVNGMIDEEVTRQINGVEEYIETRRDSLRQKGDDAESSNDSLPRFDDLAKLDRADIEEPDVKEPLVYLDGDNKEYGSAFGIMRVYCESELHTEWLGTERLSFVVTN
ncbi:uncharacterized protein LOC123545422 [Mercenaria mercenaria]|uniref:uncharacterized protein LOC123545422 n=1 Tax=Mercenaria mercenaria TaxID=6596 RepID=UPI00234E6D21|nr:uncharacterized protein LOC123545422 [Mercenaria mercenaria]